MKLFSLLIAIFLFISSGTAIKAHPGNTAADGCHYCRTNCSKWGVAEDERHCHGGSDSSDGSGGSVKSVSAEKPVPLTTEGVPSAKPSPIPTPSSSTSPESSPEAAPISESVLVSPEASPVAEPQVEEDKNTLGSDALAVSTLGGVGYGLYRLYKRKQEQ